MTGLTLTFGEARRKEGLAAVTLPASLWLHRSQRFVGSPGRGKSHAAILTALQLHYSGIGVLAVDFKTGEMVQELALRSAEDRTVLIEPKSALDEGNPWRYSPLASIDDPLEAVDATRDLLERTHEGTHLASQPRIEEFISMATMLVAGLPGVSMQTVADILSRPDVRRHFIEHPGPLASDPSRPIVLDFWREFSARATMARPDESSAKQREEVRSTKARLNRLLLSPYTAAPLDGPGNLPVMEHLERGDLVLVDASRVPYKTREMVANIFVTTVISQCCLRPPRVNQRPIVLLIDELDLLAPEALILGIEKLRAVGVSVLGAWQSLSQTSSRLEAAFSGSAVQLFFQMYETDAPELKKRYDRHYRGFAHEATRLPKGHALIVLAPDDDGDRRIEEIAFPPLPPPVREWPLPPSHRSRGHVLASRPAPVLSRERMEGDACVLSTHQTPVRPDSPDQRHSAPSAPINAEADPGDPAGDRGGGAHPPRPADAQQADRGPALRRPTRPSWIRTKRPDGA